MLNETSNDMPSRRTHRRTLQHGVHRVAWRKSCVCGHKFTRSALNCGAGKNRRIPPPCPECGRPRERCGEAIGPELPTLDDAEIVALEKLIEEDDTSLEREFHQLRVLFAKAMEQSRDRSLMMGSDSSADVIDVIPRLVSIVDKLSAIAERGVKIRQIEPPPKREVRIKFDDPRLKYIMKEAFRDTTINTIKRMLVVVIQSLDPTGEHGVAKKLPTSLRPYMPDCVAPKEEGPPKPNNGDDELRTYMESLSSPILGGEAMP